MSSPLVTSGSPLRACAARAGGGALGALIGSVLVAALDVRWMRGASPEPLPWLVAFRAAFALAAPLAAVVAAAATVASLFFHWELPVVGRWRRASAALPVAQQAELSAALFGTGVGLGIATLLGGKLALRAFATSSDTAAAAAALGPAFVGLLLLSVGASVAGALGLVRRFSIRAEPVSGLLGGVGAFVGLLLLAVWLGNTGGEGGAMGLFGVFKREELDLRLPGQLLVLFLTSYVAATSWPKLVLLPLWLVPVLGLPFLATSWLDHETLVVSLERDARLGRSALSLYRRFGDADRDSASRYFGGGDCNDRDPAVYPGADDTAGNGVDEDCSGADDAVVTLDAPQAAAAGSGVGRADWLTQHLPTKLNVVLLTVDTLRHDLGFMGYSRAVSPSIDALAKRGVVFERAYSLASYTGKSVGPMLIGRYPSETHRNWDHFDSFSAQNTFVQERFQKAGLRTVSVQGHWYFGKSSGLGRGFDELNMSAAPASPALAGDRTVNADKVSDAALAELARPALAAQQFFLWAHYVDPHAEYVAHPEHAFGDDERARYDGEVAFTDRHVGRVIEAIGKAAFGGRTAILVTSDHGEAFREHGMIRHGFEVWEELVRVPLVVYVPGAEPRRVALRRSTVDLVPTLLELAGQPVPDQGLSGVSLVDDIFPRPGAEPSPRIVLVDMAAGPHNAERQAFIEGDKKLIASEGRPLGLYDLAADPGETKDLSRDATLRAEVLARYKAKRRSLQTVRPQK